MERSGRHEVAVCSESAVESTAVVDLGRQLSSLRFEVHRLVNTLIVAS